MVSLLSDRWPAGHGDQPENTSSGAGAMPGPKPRTTLAAEPQAAVPGV